jgi:diacylglycerol kinase family enzyme
VPGIELVDSLEASCHALDPAATEPSIFVEADGELLGTLPVKISIVPNALTLLIPEWRR